MTWQLRWRNVRAAELNATLQLLVLYWLGFSSLSLSMPNFNCICTHFLVLLFIELYCKWYFRESYAEDWRCCLRNFNQANEGISRKISGEGTTFKNWLASAFYKKLASNLIIITKKKKPISHIEERESYPLYLGFV